MVQILEPDLTTPSSASRITALQNQLRRSAYWSLRQLTCELDRERVIVRGTVPCYYLKQVAQTLATRIVGIDRFQSDIDVEVE